MQNFQLLDICREWLSKRLWISFHFTICTSDIMPLLSPFSMEQQRWIILRYGVCPSVKTIRREFRQKFDVPPFDVPGELAFYRIIKRFNTTNSTVPKSKKEDGGGRPMTGRSPENIATIRQSITQAVLSRFSCLFLSTLSCHSCCCLCFVTLIVKMYMFEKLKFEISCR